MSTDDDKKKKAAERLQALLEMADDDADRREVLGKTDEELDRDLAAAGVDVERVKARAAKLQAAVAAAAKPEEAVVVRAEQRFRRRSFAVFMIAAAFVALAAATVATTIALREDESDTRVGSPPDAGDAGRADQNE